MEDIVTAFAVAKARKKIFKVTIRYCKYEDCSVSSRLYCIFCHEDDYNFVKE